MTYMEAMRVCWSCQKPEDTNDPDKVFVMTAESETPNKPFAHMHDICRKKLDLRVWQR